MSTDRERAEEDDEESCWVARTAPILRRSVPPIPSLRRRGELHLPSSGGVGRSAAEGVIYEARERLGARVPGTGS